MEKRKPRTDGYEVTLCAVGDLGQEDLADCIRLIAGGKAVDLKSAERNLPRALKVAVARKDRKIVGVGTIKPVRRGYAARTAEESKFSFEPDTPELGYVAIDPPHRGRGLSSNIAGALSQHRGSLFARTSDPRMMSALKKAGFRQRGNEWEGQRATGFRYGSENKTDLLA